MPDLSLHTISATNTTHLLQVYERSRLASEVGAAIHVAPNFTVILNRLGIFPEEFGGTAYQGVRSPSSTTPPIR